MILMYLTRHSLHTFVYLAIPQCGDLKENDFIRDSKFKSLLSLYFPFVLINVAFIPQYHNHAIVACQLSGIREPSLHIHKTLSIRYIIYNYGTFCVAVVAGCDRMVLFLSRCVEKV